MKRLLSVLVLELGGLGALLAWEVRMSRRHRENQLSVLSDLLTVDLERVLRLRAVTAKNGQRKQPEYEQATHVG